MPQMSVQPMPTVLTSTNVPLIMKEPMTVVPIVIASTHHQVTRVAARLVTPVFQLINITGVRISTNVVMEARDLRTKLGWSRTRINQFWWIRDQIGPGPRTKTGGPWIPDGSNDCHEKATCTDLTPGYKCKCNPGYTGDGVTCEDVDECSTLYGDNACDKGANSECKNLDGSYKCICKDGYIPTSYD